MADNRGMRFLAPSALLLLAACGGSSGSGETAVLAEFALPDVNLTSQTFGTRVSPRDYLGGVSVWYFGSAL